jgi:hypothetical protein
MKPWCQHHPHTCCPHTLQPPMHSLSVTDGTGGLMVQYGTNSVRSHVMQTTAVHTQYTAAKAHQVASIWDHARNQQSPGKVTHCSCKACSTVPTVKTASVASTGTCAMTAQYYYSTGSTQSHLSIMQHTAPQTCHATPSHMCRLVCFCNPVSLMLLDNNAPTADLRGRTTTLNWSNTASRMGTCCQFLR